MKYLCLGLLLLCGWAHSQSKLMANAVTHTVTTPHVRTELMAYAPDGVQPNKPFTLGLHIQHQPGWHTYWKNPGDSGLPTQLNWTLESGLTVGDIQWPVPKKIPVSNLANYGYEGAVLLAVPITVSRALPESQTHVTISLKAQWLVCKTECIPEEGEFALKVPVRGSTALNRAAFDSARANLPKPHGGAASFAPQAAALALTVQNLPPQWQGKVLEAFPEMEGLIQPAAKQEQKWEKGVWSAQIPLSHQRTTSPDAIAWLVKIAGGQNNPAVRLEVKRTGAWPPAPVAAPSAPSPALEAALANNQQVQSPSMPATGATWLSTTFWLAVLGALLGGLILNLMPCVLPVLAIKLLSFAPKKILDARSSVASIRFENALTPVIHSDHTLSFRSASALFALGVVVTFVLLGLALLALRAAGQSLGWGFQLQSPQMVIALTLLFLLVGLNLFDVFELRTVLPTRLVNFQSSNPSIEALTSGTLAVLVATPCTAPFMGASLGLAIALPAAQALLIFMALGVGMALPFIALAVVPAIGSWLLDVLPKPGSWMLVLRHFLAWPVFATVIWLLWVYAQQTNIDSAFALMFALLMVIALLWALHVQGGWLRRAALTVLTLALAASLWQVARTSAEPSAAPSASMAQMPELWQPWSISAQQAAIAQGRPVFVDFTAAWCITCQVNKSSTLNQASVIALFKAKNVVLLRADWTRADAAIAAELARLGRSGLPVYAVYVPNRVAVQLLPEVLTIGAIEDAFAKL